MRHHRVALFLLLAAMVSPTTAAAVALFDVSATATLVVESSNPLLSVINVTTAENSSQSATPGTDATASASADAVAATRTIDLAVSGQTGALVPAAATGSADATLFFTLVNSDPTNGAPVSLKLDSLLSILLSVDDPLVESASLSSVLRLQLEGAPDPVFLIEDTQTTPPNLDTGPIPGNLILTEIILFPNSSLDVSLLIGFSATAISASSAAVPEPAAGLLLMIAGVASVMRWRRFALVHRVGPACPRVEERPCADQLFATLP